MRKFLFQRLKLEHFDVTSAFTQSDIDFDVYIDPPLGYPQYEGKVLKLRKIRVGAAPGVASVIDSCYKTRTFSHGFQGALLDVSL